MTQRIETKQTQWKRRGRPIADDFLVPGPAISAAVKYWKIIADKLSAAGWTAFLEMGRAA